jgi:hypothetical protein
MQAGCFSVFGVHGPRGVREKGARCAFCYMEGMGPAYDQQDCGATGAVPLRYKLPVFRGLDRSTPAAAVVLVRRAGLLHVG